MDDATIQLSRTICAMDWAPTWPGFSDPRGISDYDRPAGGRGYRAPDGFGWVQDPDNFARYVLDLNDAATGGVMLPRVRAVKITTRTEPVSYSALFLTGPLFDPRQHSTGWQDTLAIALARVVKARGWG